MSIAGYTADIHAITSSTNKLAFSMANCISAMYSAALPLLCLLCVSSV